MRWGSWKEYVLKIRIGVACFLCISLILGMSVLGISTAWMKSERKIDDVIVGSLNPITTETSNIIVPDYGRFEEDELFSYDPNGNYIQTSDFANHEYLCEGKCYCGVDENDRRGILSSSSSVSRSLVFLVTSISSILAYSKAKDLFVEECEKRLSDICSSTAILSKVDDCERHHPIKPKSLVTWEDIVFSDRRKFWCKGRCIPKRFVKERTRQMADDFGCDKLTRTGEVQIDNRGRSSSYANKGAIDAFITEYLRDFCAYHSVREYTYVSPGGKSQKEKVRVCVGTRSPKFGANPTVHCVQTQPKPQNVRTRKYWKRPAKMKIKKRESV